MKKRILSILLSFAMIVTMMPMMTAAVYAAGEPATYNAIGSGTAADPYIIQNIDQLNDLADAVNGEGSYTNALSQTVQSMTYFKLGADIGTEGEAFTKVIGKDYDHKFYANFDGAGHTVWLNISVTGSDRYAGLFGLTSSSNAYIRNLTVKGSVSLTPDNLDSQYAQVCAGGIAGSSNHTISACRSECNVISSCTISGYGNCYAGGISGSTDSMIVNCSSSGSIKANGTHGGGGGGIAGCVSSGGSVFNSYSNASIYESKCAGGIVGAATKNGSELDSIKNCYYYGSSVAGSDYSGGIAGNNDYGTIESCYFDNDVLSDKVAVGNNGTSGTVEEATVLGLQTEQTQAASGAALSTELAENKPLLDLLNDYIEDEGNSTETDGWYYWTLTSDGYPGFHAHDDCSFTEWTDTLAGVQNGSGKTAANSLPAEPGNYYLTQDVTLDYFWNVPDGETNLCLNGHVIKASRQIKMGADVELSIYDCGTEDHYYTYNTEGKWSYIETPEQGQINTAIDVSDITDGTATGDVIKLPGGAITGYDSTIIMNEGGKLKLYGGNIVGNAGTWGTVDIRDDNTTKAGGTFDMYGGSVIGNGGTYGGVGIDNHSSFNMYGGAISYNTKMSGGGVYINSYSTFTMYDGVISHNKSNGGSGYGGGGVAINGADALFFMKGGIISDNESIGYGGGGVYIGNGVMKMEGGTITGNKVTDAASEGGAIYTRSSGEVITLGGNANISGNTKLVDGQATPNNIKLSGPVTVGTGAYGNGVKVPTTGEGGMMIGVTGSDAGGKTMLTGVTEAVAGCFFPDTADYKLVYSAGSGGYSSTVTCYPVHAISNEKPSAYSETNNGYLTIDKTSAYETETVTITVCPNSGEGYGLKKNSLKVTYGASSTCNLTQDTNEPAKYTFAMPGSAVTVTAEFELLPVVFDPCNGGEQITSGDIPETDPEFGDYFFAGWYDAPIGGTMLAAEAELVPGDTYYAHWKIAETDSHFILVLDGGLYIDTNRLGSTESYFDQETLDILASQYGISYDSSTCTLALNNAAITATSAEEEALWITSADDEVNIVLTGNCRIGAKVNGSYISQNGIANRSDSVIISGTGDLEIYAAETGIWCNNSITLEGSGSVTIDCGYCGLLADEISIISGDTSILVKGEGYEPAAINAEYYLNIGSPSQLMGIDNAEYESGNAVAAGNGSMADGILLPANWESPVLIYPTTIFDPCNGSTQIKSETKPGDPSLAPYTFDGWYNARFGGTKLEGEPVEGTAYYAHWTKGGKDVLVLENGLALTMSDGLALYDGTSNYKKLSDADLADLESEYGICLDDDNNILTITGSPLVYDLTAGEERLTVLLDGEYVMNLTNYDATAGGSEKLTIEVSGTVASYLKSNLSTLGAYPVIIPGETAEEMPTVSLELDGAYLDYVDFGGAGTAIAIKLLPAATAELTGEGEDAKIAASLAGEFEGLSYQWQEAELDTSCYTMVTEIPDPQDIYDAGNEEGAEIAGMLTWVLSDISDSPQLPISVNEDGKAIMPYLLGVEIGENNVFIPALLVTQQDFDFNTASMDGLVELLLGDSLNLTLTVENAENVILYEIISSMLLEIGNNLTTLESNGDDSFTGTIPGGVYMIFVVTSDDESPAVTVVSAEPSAGCSVITEKLPEGTAYALSDAQYIEDEIFGDMNKFSEEDDGTYTPLIKLEGNELTGFPVEDLADGSKVYLPMLIATLEDVSFATIDYTDVIILMEGMGQIKLSLKAENADRVILMNLLSAMTMTSGDLVIEELTKGDNNIFSGNVPKGLYEVFIVCSGEAAPTVSDVQAAPIAGGGSVNKDTIQPVSGATSAELAYSKTTAGKAYGCEITIPKNGCIAPQTVTTNFILSDYEASDEPAPTPTTGGGGTPTITVPVSGDKDSVKISATVSGSNATVKNVTAEQLDKVGTGENVTVDLSGLNKSVSGVTIPKTTLENVAASEASGLEVKLPNGTTAVFDSTTVAAVAEQAAGSNIQLVVDKEAKAEQALTAAQKETVKALNDALVLDAYFVSGGKRISDFKGGEAELTVSYPTTKPVRVWYLAEDGTKELVPSTFDGKNAYFTVKHFSHYVIEVLDGSGYAACPKDATCAMSAFGDLDASVWYHDGVHYCLDNGLMNGVSDTQFAPNTTLTRGMVVTVLARLNGVEAGTGSAWYVPGQEWAVKNGVSDGTNMTANITREQLATMLYRYAQSKGEGFTGSWMFLLDFVDRTSISSWADEAVHWCSMKGIVNGKDGKVFDPQGNATRAEAAAMFQRFCENVTK